MEVFIKAWLEHAISKGFKDAVAELEKDDSIDLERAFNKLEERLKKRKENSLSHKRIDDMQEHSYF